ncbi:hypothetical protein [Pseudoclavibacter helvolus]|uniref:hypothetical protein n=1 Tax=Pseudoclavibacter helvolus TaxID=255205 RepID=UPI000838645F|nr:hypothetical protein [Pseudoclavibacter helvolus]
MANTAPELAPNLMQDPRQRRPTGMEWLIGTLAQAVLFWPWLVVFSAPVGYRPSAVERRRLTGERHRWPVFTALSTFGWMSGSFVLLSALIPPLLLITVPIMMLVTARKSASPHPLSLRDGWATARRVVTSSRGWIIASRVALGCLGILALLLLLATAASAFGWKLPLWLSYGFWSAVPVIFYCWAVAREVGQRVGVYAAQEAAEHDRFAGSVAGVLNDSPRCVRRQDSLEGSVLWDVPVSIRASFVSALSVWSSRCGPIIRASIRR